MVTPLRFEFLFTPAMLKAVDRAMIESGVYDDAFRARQKGAHRKAMRMAPVWFLAVVGVAAILADAFGAPGWDGLATALVVAFFVTMGQVAATTSLDAYREQLLGQRKADRQRVLASTGPIEVTLTERGVVYRDHFTEATFEWPIIVWSALVEGYLVMFVLSGRAICVPVSALPAEVSADEVLRGIRRRHEVTGGRAEVVRRHLLHAEQECPKCGYSLQGVPDALCPECGRPFVEEDL